MHLIADNIGWFYENKKMNLDDFAKENNQEVLKFHINDFLNKMSNEKSNLDQNSETNSISINLAERAQETVCNKQEAEILKSENNNSENLTNGKNPKEPLIREKKIKYSF